MARRQFFDAADAAVFAASPASELADGTIVERMLHHARERSPTPVACVLAGGDATGEVCDLADLASVRAFARRLRARYPKGVGTLALNAGLAMSTADKAPRRTADRRGSDTPPPRGSPADARGSDAGQPPALRRGLPRCIYQKRELAKAQERTRRLRPGEPLPNP